MLKREKKVQKGEEGKKKGEEGRQSSTTFGEPEVLIPSIFWKKGSNKFIIAYFASLIKFRELFVPETNITIFQT